MPVISTCPSHIILSTHGSWPPGDPRGFRSRKHRIHSSGDYHAPPPAGEHRRLYEYARRLCPRAVIIPAHLRAVIGQALLAKIRKQEIHPYAVAVGPTHTHLLAELPDDHQQAKKIAGTWKQAASFAVRDALPGKIWGEGGKPIPVRDQEHFDAAVAYILDHAKEGAWIWLAAELGKSSQT